MLLLYKEGLVFCSKDANSCTNRNEPSWEDRQRKTQQLECLNLLFWLTATGDALVQIVKTGGFLHGFFVCFWTYTAWFIP